MLLNSEAKKITVYRVQHLCSNTSCPLYASAHVCFSIQLISNLIKNLAVKKKEINSSKIQVFKRCTKTWAPPNLIYSQHCTLLIKQSTHKKHRTEGSSSARYSKTRAMPLTSNIVLHSTHFKSWKKQLVPQNTLCPLKTPHFLSSHYVAFPFIPKLNSPDGQKQHYSPMQIPTCWSSSYSWTRAMKTLH